MKMKAGLLEIGARIAARRKELHMTQDKLTGKVGMSLNQLSNIENSHSVPTVETILKLSDALKVTPDYFLLGICKGAADNDAASIAQKTMLCTKKQQKLVSEFISLLIRENY